MKMVFRNLAQTPSIFKPMFGKQLTEMLGKQLARKWRRRRREGVLREMLRGRFGGGR